MEGGCVGNEGKRDNERGNEQGTLLERKLPYHSVLVLEAYQKGLRMSRIFGQGLKLLNDTRGLSCVYTTTQSSKGTAGSNQYGVPWNLDIFKITFPT